VEAVPAAAAKPGFYTIRPGDTLIRIALETGQNWRDLVRWNNLENPNMIEVGQSLRVTAPPPGTTPEVTAVRPVTPAASAAVAPVASASEARPPASAPVVQTAPPAPAVVARVPDAAEDDVPWAWPTAGVPTVLAGFDEARNKGLDIGGKAGDPVLASADGRVVYAGAGLRGYGNLIILKHNNTYLTAYAHNQALLVKEDQNVRKGQKIAEMGNSDADRVKLHFEIRKQGKPVDPSKYLPR
jgi:lipoprotein NlpD